MSWWFFGLTVTSQIVLNTLWIHLCMEISISVHSWNHLIWYMGYWPSARSIWPSDWKFLLLCTHEFTWYMGFWPSAKSIWLNIVNVFSSVFMNRDETQYPDFGRTSLVIKGFVTWQYIKYIARNNGQSLRLTRSGTISQRAIWFILCGSL